MRAFASLAPILIFPASLFGQVLHSHRTGDLLHYCAPAEWSNSAQAMAASSAWQAAMLLVFSSEPVADVEAVQRRRILLVAIMLRLGETTVVGAAASPALNDIGGDSYILEMIKLHLDATVPLMEPIPPPERDAIPSALMSAQEARQVAAICIRERAS